MKIIVIYYSFEGNTKLIANTITQAVDSDLLRLQPAGEVKAKSFLKYVWCGKQVMLNKKPELLPYHFNPDDYDLIFMGTPVWAWSFAPPWRTFLTENKLENKNIALFCCHGGGKGRIFPRWQDALSGNKILGEIDFRDPLKVKTEFSVKRASEWARDIVKKC